MSKSQKGNCKFIIRRGPKVGKKCGNGCRGDFCKAHKPSRLNYTKNYNDNRNELSKESIIKKKLKEIKKGERKFPDLDVLKFKIKKNIDDLMILKKEYYGYCICINPEFQCPIKTSVKEYLESKEYYDEVRKEFDEMAVDTRKKFKNFDNYLIDAKERYLLLPNTYITGTAFNGSPIQAEKNITILKKKYIELDKKINLMKYYCSELEKIQDKDKKIFSI